MPHNAVLKGGGREVQGGQLYQLPLLCGLLSIRTRENQ